MVVLLLPFQVTLLSPLRRQKVKPEAKLESLCIPLRPVDSSLQPALPKQLLELPAATTGSSSSSSMKLTGRDVLPNGRVIYNLLLTYKLKVTEPGKYKPTIPATNR